jgi:hypothetical protein
MIRLSENSMYRSSLKPGTFRIHVTRVSAYVSLLNEVRNEDVVPLCSPKFIFLRSVRKRS